MFALLLQVEDITPYLKDNKLVFLFGKEELDKDYPLDFKGIYGIDYETVNPTPVKVDEIQRILINWQVRPSSGASSFFNPVMDGHPNTIKVAVAFTLSQFAAIYRCFLQGRTVAQFMNLFFTEYYGVPNWGGMWKHRVGMLFSEDSKNVVFGGPLFQRFWQTLSNLFPPNYIPKSDEWLKAFALAKAAAFEQSLNARVAPAISIFFNHGDGWQGVLAYLYPILRKFKYVRAISLLRRLTINLGSHTDAHFGALKDCHLNLLRQFIESDFFDNDFPYASPLFLPTNDEWLPYRRVMRFEDLKLEPKASMESLCDFFDIPMNDSLFKTEINGKEIGCPVDYYENTKETTGFTTVSVFNKHEKRYAPYDFYRVEVVMGKEYEYYGYKNMYYTDGKEYSKEEIIEMFKKPFKVEEFDTSEYQKAEEPIVRKRMYASLERLLSHPFDESENGEKLVPIPWLKPKEEFMKGELYE